MHPAPLRHSGPGSLPRPRPRTPGLRRHPLPPLGARLARRVGAAGILLLLGLSVAGAAVAARDPMAPLRLLTRAQLRLEGARLLGWEGVVAQRTPWDCGPAALATLLHQLGRPAPSLAELGRLAGTTPRGTAMGGLSSALQALGVPHLLHPALPWRLGAAPVLAWVRPGHFVVVERGPATGDVDVLDPRVGRYRIAAATFARTWPGAALVPEVP